MKTYKNLYPQLCTFENLYLAFCKARRGKRSRRDVAAFENNLDVELLQLQEEFQSQTYRPSPYRHFTIYEGKGSSRGPAYRQLDQPVLGQCLPPLPG